MAALRAVARDAKGSAHVFLDGPVGFPKEGGMTAAMFREQLAAANGAPLVVHFNSEGGIVTQGMAMYNALRAYKAKKVGVVDGLCASIASVVLMGCDEIRVAKGGYIMIHNPSNAVAGEASDLRAAADTLDSMRDELLDIYEARTGLERAKLAKMLDAETYLTAEEAVEEGIADAVESFEARIALTAVARLDSSKVPAGLRASAKGKEKAMKPKMKAAIEAQEAALAALKAKAEANPDAEPEDTEDEPHDEDEDEPEDSEDDDEEKKEGEKALLATVYAMTGSTSPSVALGKLAATAAKGVQSASASRAVQIKAAVKSGLMLPALAKQAAVWPEKAWNTFLAGIGGTKALKLGATHSDPETPPEELEDKSKPAVATGDAAKIHRLMGTTPEALKKTPASAPQLQKGAAR